MTSLRKPDNERHHRPVLRFLLILFLAYLSVKFVSVALTQELTFDGAQTVQLANNLLKNGSYATSYNELVLFDTKLTTGVTVVLPTSIIFRFFGESFETAQMVNAIYLMLLFCATTYFLNNCLILNEYLSFLTLFLLLGTPRLFEFGYGLLGEVPMLFYMLMIAIMLNRFQKSTQLKEIFISGIFLGLAFLTKTIALISIPAVLLAIISLVINYFPRKPKIVDLTKRFFLYLVSLVLGFGIPVLLFEFYKFSSLGITAYMRMVREWWIFVIGHPGIIQITNNKIQFLSKLNDRLDVLSGYLNLDRTYIIVLLFFLFITFSVALNRNFHGNKKRTISSTDLALGKPTVLFLIVLTLSFLGWWLVLAGLAWERYVFPGVFLAGIVLVVILADGLGTVKRFSLGTSRRVKLVFSAGLAILLLTLLAWSGNRLGNSENYRISFLNTRNKVGFQKAGDFIAQLPPNAKIYGYGWWEAPVISFAANRQFYNLFSTPKLFTAGTLDNAYFVNDFFAYYLDPEADHIILDQFITKQVYVDNESKIFIYQLLSRPLFAYQPFTTEEKEEVSYSKIDFTSNDLKVISRNVFIQEQNANGKWVQPTSAFLLKYNGEQRLHLEILFQDLASYTTNPINLDVYVNQKLVSTYRVNSSGPIQVDLPLKNVPKGALELTLVCNSQFVIKSPDRVISLFIVKMELLD